jgi:hypothetical protein
MFTCRGKMKRIEKVKKYENCCGCLTHQEDKIDCMYSKYNNHGECPCTNCILKMVCSLSCDQMKIWANIIVKKIIYKERF